VVGSSRRETSSGSTRRRITAFSHVPYSIKFKL
jgi:hypothetical protein